MAYEVQLEDRKKDEQQLQSKKKVLAFHISSDLDNSDDNEEEMAMISRKFRKFLKQGKFNLTCFNCNKSGHIKKDCPLLKNKGKFKFNKFNKKKKDYQASWENSDLSTLTKKKPLKLQMFAVWLKKKMRYNILNY